MKPNRLFRRVSLFTFGTCVIAGSALGNPANLFEGIHFNSSGGTAMVRFTTDFNSQPRAGVQLTAYDGSVILYSSAEPSGPGVNDGGINLQGSPVNVILESASSNADNAKFQVWNSSRFWGATASPLLKIDGATGNTTFDGSNVSINSGSLSVGGSAVLTSASAASVLTGQNFVQLGTGGVLNIASTAASISNITGAITVAGGIGVAKDSFINGVRIGRGAGSNPLIVMTNTAVGMNTLNSNTSGSQNTAVGVEALKSLVSASYNTAVGTNSLKNHVSGDFNTAVGYNTLQSSTTAIYNTAIGNAALSSNTTGSANSALGSNALFNNSTGTSNNAIGLSALQSNTTGTTNNALGVGALNINSTGGSNTAVGHIALGGNTTGSSNVAVGHQAGRYLLGNPSVGLNTTSSIYGGANTRSLGATDANSIIIGTNGEGKGSNTTVIGNSSTTHTYLQGETNSASLRVAGNTVLEGDTVLEGSVTLAEAQGDISMGDYQ